MLFIGLPEFSNEAPYVPSLLVEFRKRLDDEILAQINEMIIAYDTPDDQDLGSGGEMSDGSKEGAGNSGTIILDATCAPQNISYPQDVNLLNEARENLESLIDRICCDYSYYKPRMYRRNARRDYLNLAKCKNIQQKRYVKRSNSSCNTSAGTWDILKHLCQMAWN